MEGTTPSHRNIFVLTPIDRLIRQMVSLLWSLLTVMVTLPVAASRPGGGIEPSLPIACPLNSWCLPAGLCHPGYVLFDAKNPTGETSQEEYVCGATDTTPNYVCCDTQELLPHHFKPTPFHWYFQGKGKEITRGLVVAPWPTFSIKDLEELENLDDSHVSGHQGVHNVRDVEDEHKLDDDDRDTAGQHVEPGERLYFDVHSASEKETYENQRLHEEIELLEDVLRVSEDGLRELEEQLSAEGRENRDINEEGNANQVDHFSHYKVKQKAGYGRHANEKYDSSFTEQERTKIPKPSAGNVEPQDFSKPEGLSERNERPPPPQICPSRSMCVPWNLCEDHFIMYDAESSDEKDYLCGLTEDSELFVCCGRPNFTSDPTAVASSPVSARVESLSPDTAPSAISSPGPAAPPDPELVDVSAPSPAPVQAPTPAPLPLDHLADVFRVFSPPYLPHVTMPPLSASSEAARVAVDHRHYLSEVLLNERQRRSLPEGENPPRGQVFYPSQMAARRLRHARRVAAAAGSEGGGVGEAVEGTALRSTLGGQGGLKSAGSLGTVKLGSLSLPQQQQQALLGFESTPVEPVAADAGQEASLPEVISVTPRTVARLEDVDIRPLPVPMWRGEAPPTPAGRVADSDLDSEEPDDADDSDSEQPPGSVLSRILGSLPDSPTSRRGHQGQSSVRGQFFGDPPPVSLHRPPFYQPPPPSHLQHGADPLVHGAQTEFHFVPLHQGVLAHLSPPHRRPSHDRPLKHESVHQGPVRHEPVHHDRVHQKPLHHESVHQKPLHPESVHQRPVHREPPSHQPHHSTTGLHPTAAAQCGRGAAVGLHARVTTGRGEEGVTNYGQYPWHVGVLTVDLTYLCAGVLVAPRLVLTVAHCVSPLPSGTPLLVRVGDWDLASEQELYPAYDVEVFRTVVHPDFYAGNLQNDIALLLLDPPVEGLPHVQPACLPPPHAEFAHQHCWVAGWGQARHVSGDLHDTSSYSWKLRDTELAVVPAGSCEHHLRSTHLGPFYRLPRRGVLCATGRGGRDACFGDGGGALLCPLREHGPGGPLYAAGLVSWGIGCGQDIPAVYTKVSDYHGWIISVLEDLEGSVQFPYIPVHARDSTREGRQQ